LLYIVIITYKDVLSKEITLAYRIGTGKRNYIEKTIYGYEKQNLTSQNLSLNVRFRQKWGNISSYLNATQFLNDGSNTNFGKLNFVFHNHKLFFQYNFFSQYLFYMLG
jgi:hypothetical protein